MLLLEDFKGLNEKEVIETICREYGVEVSLFDKFDILIGEQSEQNYDGQSFFLLIDKKGLLYEVHGGHCSCYGFEGQFELEKTTIEALTFIAKAEHSSMSRGVKNFILNYPK